VELARTQFGAVDASLYNCGTLGELGPVAEMTERTWREVLDTNLTGAFLAAKHQIAAMRPAKRGSMVFTSSFVGNTIGLPGMGAYAASKAGLVGLVRVLASEHGSEGIRVNAMLPGGTRTDMAGKDPAFHDYVANLHALKRMAEPREIAEAAVFLLSDQSSFVTGAALFVDGGNSICKT
jgi:NAD(P)-dependent dehydrogenase (short-subunit alcohol dehydrogenase family)